MSQTASIDPDHDLIPALRNGDEGAFRTLMDRRLPTVHRLIYRILGDAAEAEDIAQETFLKFWSTAPDWTAGQARILTWLCRVATHAAYDRIRRKRPLLMGDDLDPMDERETHESRIIKQQRWDDLQAAIMQLPDRQRTALSLCYDEAMPQRDAAKIMDISEKAYEALLVRGRRALKSVMMERDHV